MPKDALFSAYDLKGKKPHRITAPPTKLSKHRLKLGEWKITKPARKTRSSIKDRKAKKKGKKIQIPKVRHRAHDILRDESPEICCLHCGSSGDDRACSSKCYRQFLKDHFTSPIDIPGPGPIGYGAYLKPTASIAKGEYVGEYIGEVRPLHSKNSHYRIEIPKVCAIDSEKAGNWTRFINSHCKPNLRCFASWVGKRHVVLFEAVRAIEGGEELTFQYGGYYFEKAGMLCKCGAKRRSHMPPGALKK